MPRSSYTRRQLRSQRSSRGHGARRELCVALEQHPNAQAGGLGLGLRLTTRRSVAPWQTTASWDVLPPTMAEELFSVKDMVWSVALSMDGMQEQMNTEGKEER
jgi:hypothetical protein